MGVLTLALWCAAAAALRPPLRHVRARRGIVVSALPSMPGQSRERISEDVARARSGWPHWSEGGAAASDEAASDEAAAAAKPVPRPAAAYTLAYYQERVGRAGRHDALLAVAAATGALCGAARDPGARVDAEVGAVLRALAAYASERGVSLDAAAAASLGGGGGSPPGGG